jgi:ACT domain
MATDLSISLPDEPGGLAKAAKALGAAGVNVEGIAGLGGGGHGHVHLLVEDAGAARTALEGAGVTIEGDLAQSIADAGVNLAACYVASRSRVVFSSDDPAGLRSALGA